MPLLIYNSLSRQKEAFQPIHAETEQVSVPSPQAGNRLGQVLMYVCGVTVYDYCHLGHARTYVVWDMVRRYLTFLGYRVKFVQNFTDIDDKILQRALERQESMTDLAERFIQAYFEDMDRLNILRADNYPRATQSLSSIFALIQSLELKQFAYRIRVNHTPTNPTEQSDVYYAVRQFGDYGQLSGRKLEDMQAGASGRVDSIGSVAQKRDPFDFALWKSAPQTEPGFDSPWGWGRPGWHIECSAMVKETLGNSIDIHAGGADLIFPHHENELAQSEPILGKPLARYWMHNGFLNINGEKMSKSLGNFTTLRDALKVYDPMALRLFFLQTHYRSPIDLTETAMAAASQGWQTLSKGMQAAHHFLSSLHPQPDHSPPSEPFASDQINRSKSESVKQFQSAMDDDFATPAGVALAFDLAKELSRQYNLLTHQGEARLPHNLLLQKSQDLLQITEVLGLGLEDQPPIEENVEATIQVAIETGEKINVSELIEQRKQAKKERNFAEADRIRNHLKSLGISLIDQPDGSTRWRQGDSP
ncbi:MAG: cysteine--tRNA ligase [Cyanobacteriota bacterium]|nr:cysteine--tRNA ligase [Cyanobacteriota bacterium]